MGGEYAPLFLVPYFRKLEPGYAGHVAGGVRVRSYFSGLDLSLLVVFFLDQVDRSGRPEDDDCSFFTQDFMLQVNAGEWRFVPWIHWSLMLRPR